MACVLGSGLLAKNIEESIQSDTVPRLNELSLVITDLIDGSYQLRYERRVGKQMSVGLGLAYKGESGLINISGINRERLKTGNISYSGIKIIPDVRYYLKKTQQYELDGFYFGAYMKHFHFSSDINGTFLSIENTPYDIDLEAKVNVYSLGFMGGYKLAVSKRFNVDFLIFGPGTSRHDYRIKNNKPLPEEFYTQLNDALKDLSVYDFINTDFRFDYNGSKTGFNTASFRYGLTIGYTF
jgi:hypothetical protein